MFDLLHQLRQKPARVRHQIALGVSGGFTFLLLMLWFGSFDARFSQIEEVDKPKPPTDALIGTVKGFTEASGTGWKAALSQIASATPINEPSVNTDIPSIDTQETPVPVPQVIPQSQPVFDVIPQQDYSSTTITL